MIIVRGTVNGKSYWANVKNSVEAKALIAQITKAYKTVRIWMEDVAGRVVMTYEKLVDRVRMAVPKKKSFWSIVGVALGFSI